MNVPAFVVPALLSDLDRSASVIVLMPIIVMPLLQVFLTGKVERARRIIRYFCPDLPSREEVQIAMKETPLREMLNRLPPVL